MPVFLHHFLVRAPSLEKAQEKVRLFLERYELLSYENLRFPEGGALRGDAPDFWPRLRALEAENRKAVREILSEISREGYRELLELADLPQGYLSKLLHTAVHILDGFLGIDSRFYNLEEDSHGVSPALRGRILAEPASWWLVAAEGYTPSPEPMFEFLRPPFKR
ncbi:hypothetical protein FVE67_08175 [Thermosulfurimonas marina]|uniref:Uncharacterized protein n=1 Tax=Thermosulfurimonas marina TaxID=2047767 RepID=A0A6H1WU91_9BACT|nr:hypothetical protein [Thermosulfurimonas marina]QJA06767.1 hypothetical protein FVE67_08175 [Thermosulfurimonas marina]